MNFVLGAGLHGCGFGGGGVPHVFAELGLQGLFAAAAVRYVASGTVAEAERAARQSLPRADQRWPEVISEPIATRIAGEDGQTNCPELRFGLRWPTMSAKEFAGQQKELSWTQLKLKP